MDLILVPSYPSPPQKNSCAEDLPPRVMVAGDGVLGRRLRLDEVMMMGQWYKLQSESWAGSRTKMGKFSAQVQR